MTPIRESKRIPDTGTKFPVLHDISNMILPDVRTHVLHRILALYSLADRIRMEYVLTQNDVNILVGNPHTIPMDLIPTKNEVITHRANHAIPYLEPVHVG